MGEQQMHCINTHFESAFQLLLMFASILQSLFAILENLSKLK